MQAELLKRNDERLVLAHDKKFLIGVVTVRNTSAVKRMVMAAVEHMVMAAAVEHVVAPAAIECMVVHGAVKHAVAPTDVVNTG